MKKTNSKIIAGNWKMNLSISQSAELTKQIITQLSENDIKPTKTRVIISPHFLALNVVNEVLKSSSSFINPSAQDVHWEEEGAYTGKVSVSMLRDMGLQFVIVGHSEQRTYFNETDETVNKKVLKLLENKMTPIICIGENLEERESGILKDVLKKQVEGAYQNVTPEQASKTIIAYEPVWAIGTGVTASPEQAQETHLFVRELIKNYFSQDIAEALPILYGGSMNPKNARELLSQSDINGGLIGGASLKADSFSEIITIAENL